MNREEASGTPARAPIRILALINPSAGRGATEKTREGILAGVADSGDTVDFVELEPGVNGSDLTRKAAADGYGLILVAGGDGTLAMAASGLVGSGVPLGIIPTGTANIVAMNLGVPASVKLATRAALTGTPAPYDVGRTSGGRIFLLAAGAGYDADLIRDADRELKRRFGPLAYIFAMFKNLGVKRARFTVELDGSRRLHFHAKTILVCNVGRTMGALPLAPDAKVDDGQLDVVVFAFTGFWHLLLLFFAAIFGGLKQDPRVKFFRAREVRITASRPMPLQVDGEFIDRTTPIEMSVVPGGITILRPPRPAVDLAEFAESALKAIREFPARLAEESRAPQVAGRPDSRDD